MTTTSAKYPGYILMDTIGKGAYGKVKLAEEVTSGKRFAIKEMDLSEVSRRGMLKAVESEISVMEGLNHPNIISLHQVIRTDAHLALVMELAEGGELFDRVANSDLGCLEEPTARSYFRQLIDGIEYCHNQGVCHRDLKLENLLLASDGSLKISDFGFSRELNGQSMLNSIVGTLCYLAPEVIIGQGYNGKKADIWSVGVILYVMVQGTYPFPAKDYPTKIRQIKQGKYDPLGDWVSDLCYDLIDRMLDVDAANRIDIADIRKHPWFCKKDAGVHVHANVNTNVLPNPSLSSVTISVSNNGNINGNVDYNFDDGEGDGEFIEDDELLMDDVVEDEDEVEIDGPENEHDIGNDNDNVNKGHSDADAAHAHVETSQSQSRSHAHAEAAIVDLAKLREAAREKYANADYNYNYNNAYTTGVTLTSTPTTSESESSSVSESVSASARQSKARNKKQEKEISSEISPTSPTFSGGSHSQSTQPQNRNSLVQLKEKEETETSARFIPPMFKPNVWRGTRFATKQHPVSVLKSVTETIQRLYPTSKVTSNVRKLKISVEFVDLEYVVRVFRESGGVRIVEFTRGIGDVVLFHEVYKKLVRDLFSIGNGGNGNCNGYGRGPARIVESQTLHSISSMIGHYEKEKEKDHTMHPQQQPIASPQIPLTLSSPTVGTHAHTQLLSHLQSPPSPSSPSSSRLRVRTQTVDGNLHKLSLDGE